MIPDRAIVSRMRDYSSYLNLYFMLLVDDSNRNIFQSIARIEESLPVLERPQAGEDAYTSELRMVSSIIALHYVYTSTH